MKVTLLTAVFTLFTAIVFCQATTELEYNYMKKGYWANLAMGNDLKSGYKLQTLKPYESGSVTINFYVLRRDNGSLVGMMIKTVSSDAFGSGTNYYAMPAANTVTENSYGWQNFWQDVETMTSGMKSHFIRWLTYNYAFYTAVQATK